jgi:Fe-S cluster assembly iron-binding protein IscA
MLSLTDQASEYLNILLEDHKVPEQEAIRIEPTKDGFSLKKDSIEQSDKCFEYEDRVVLIVKPQHAILFEDKTLDLKEGPDGDLFVIR